MKVAGLFAGIGGFEVGLQENGHTIVLTCEKDEIAAAVLRQNIGVLNYDDIRSLSSLPGDIDLITAGFPCQDLSPAGKTRGLAGDQSILVIELFRLLRKVRTPWVLIENVPFMARLHAGSMLTLIVAELEELGYQWAYRIVNTLAWLPQRRRRLFLLASRIHDPADVLLVDDIVIPSRPVSTAEVAHGFYWTEGNRGLGLAIDAVPPLKCGSSFGIPAPPAVLLPNGNIIKPDIRDAERLNGFELDWTLPAEAIARGSVRWRLVGNAVSVPVSRWIGSRLRVPGAYEKERDRGQIQAGNWPSAARSSEGERVAVDISPTPVWEARPSLHEFLKFPGTPLSAKAAGGFYRRARNSTLRFPEGFLAAIARHIERVSSGAIGLLNGSVAE